MSTSSARCSRAWSSRASPPPRAFAKPAPGPADRRSLAAHPLLPGFARGRRSGWRLFGPCVAQPQALGMVLLRPEPRRTPDTREDTSSVRVATNPWHSGGPASRVGHPEPPARGRRICLCPARGSPKQILRCARDDTSLVQAAENPWHSGGTASRVGHPEPPGTGAKDLLVPGAGEAQSRSLAVLAITHLRPERRRTLDTREDTSSVRVAASPGARQDAFLLRVAGSPHPPIPRPST
jgi:hypothetical protein